MVSRDCGPCASRNGRSGHVTSDDFGKRTGESGSRMLFRPSTHRTTCPRALCRYDYSKIVPMSEACGLIPFVFPPSRGVRRPSRNVIQKGLAARFMHRQRYAVPTDGGDAQVMSSADGPRPPVISDTSPTGRPRCGSGRQSTPDCRPRRLIIDMIRLQIAGGPDRRVCMTICAHQESLYRHRDFCGCMVSHAAQPLHAKNRNG
jgi:hypothetical protein